MVYGKIIPNGTEVLIFNYIREWEPNQNDVSSISCQETFRGDDLIISGPVLKKFKKPNI